MVGGGLMELEEWSRLHSLSYRYKVGQSGTSDQPSQLFGCEKHKLMEMCARPSFVVCLCLAVLTFAGRHVDTFAIAAEWEWPAEGPGHII